VRERGRDVAARDGFGDLAQTTANRASEDRGRSRRRVDEVVCRQ
jgi:hypothetical protein